MRTHRVRSPPYHWHAAAIDAALEMPGTFPTGARHHGLREGLYQIGPSFSLALIAMSKLPALHPNEIP